MRAAGTWAQQPASNLEMIADAYPLDHWSSWRQALSQTVMDAVAHAACDPVSGRTALATGATFEPLSGGGNHDVLRLDADGHSFCLKLPQTTHRHRGIPELALRREVGGMCVVTTHIDDRCPRPLSWDVEPAWLLADLLPGQHLGNVSLSAPQIIELAESYKELYSITPESIGEPLWPIEWDTAFLVTWLSEQLPLLLDRGRGDEQIAEAAALVGAWLDSDAPAHFLEDSDRLVFARGDQNMANCLWDGERIRFCDFEYCGWNDLPRDLSLVTDHIQSYATPVPDWDGFVEQFEMSVAQRCRLQSGRQRQALTWLTKECLKPGSLRGIPEEGRVERLLSRARALAGT